MMSVEFLIIALIVVLSSGMGLFYHLKRVGTCYCVTPQTWLRRGFALTFTGLRTVGFFSAEVGLDRIVKRIFEAIANR